MRHFRGSRRRAMAPVIQSYKKVLNVAGSSHAAAAVEVMTLTQGVDSVAAGQTSVTDAQVPTGAIIKYILIQFSAANATSALAFLHLSVQLLRSGQSAISPLVIGGNPQRNQVFHQDLMTLPANASINRTIRFKVPKSFQRVREGDKWIINRSADLVWGDALQVIYKFYR